MKRAGALCVVGSAFLLVSLVLAQSSKTAPKKSAPPQDYSFTVTASQVWTDTGLDLEAGDRVHVYGTVMACEGPTPSEKAHLPLPSAPGGSLLVKVHGETAPILASPDADLPHPGCEPPLFRSEWMALSRNDSGKGARGLAQASRR